jgi:hypothetical protein
LSQYIIAILWQFDSQGAFAEQHASTPRYPFQDNCSLNFANVDVADRAPNEEPFDKIEETPNSDTTDEFTENMKFDIVGSYLHRRPPRMSPLSQESPMFTGNADFTICNLLVMISTHSWPRPGLSFSCPNPSCHSKREATEDHLWQHQELSLDGTFCDPLISTLAGLIGSRMDMSDGSNYACAFRATSERRLLRSLKTIS